MRLVPSTCGNLNADELAGVIHRLSHDDPSVTSLTMSWSNLGDDGCEKLSDSLRFNNYLVDLDIYSNNISSAGLIRMGLALECVQVLAFACRLASNLLDDPPTPQIQHHASQHQPRMESHRRDWRLDSHELVAHRQHVSDGAEHRQLRRFPCHSEVPAPALPCLYPLLTIFPSQSITRQS